MNYSENSVGQDESLCVAIIGMTGRFPMANNIDEFWENLKNGIECIRRLSDEELSNAGVDAATLNDKNYIRISTMIEGVDLFDAAFFGIAPRDAEIMDPQHRLFLEAAWEVLEHAGYDPGSHAGAIGVYAGVSRGSYLSENVLGNPKVMQHCSPMQIMLGNMADFLSTRVAYHLNLHGPALTVQSACSTSLVAVHLACQSLLNGECDMALAGGVCILDKEKPGYFHIEGGITSSDGHCRAFDAQASGTVAGSGLGIVLLKTLDKARADGDTIHAVIRGSALNNDGADKVGFMAPSISGQAAAISEALAVAGVAADSISYVEAHGTGTVLGDPIELKALHQAFRESTERKQFCAIGSVKTNIGHLDVAAGVTGLIKTVLALQHRQIPASLHYQRPNPHIDFENSPFYVNSKLAEWCSTDGPRRAGVSSFGIGGNNVHVIVEEAPLFDSTNWSRPCQLLALSARTPAALDAMAGNLKRFLISHPEINLADAAYTLHVGRRHFNHRRTLVCNSIEDAILGLEKNDFVGAQSVSTDQSAAAPVVFMFPGQGAQYVNMAKELYESEVTFREEVNTCANLLQPLLGFDLRDILFPAPEKAEHAASLLNMTENTQPALFVIEFALARQFNAWGITPAAMIGHSVGEYVAACLAGVFSLQDGLKLIVQRGKLIAGLPVGAMLGVQASERELQSLLEEDVWIAAVNAPSICSVSGTIDGIERLKRRLQDDDIGFQPLKTSHAFHSGMMDPALAEFAASFSGITLHPPSIPYLSNVTGNWIEASEATDPSYWVSHLRQPVRFADCIGKIAAMKTPLLLEVGPGHALSGLAKQQGKIVAFPTLPHATSSASAVSTSLDALGKLWSCGTKVDWKQFYRQEKRKRIALPTYPFERQHYWLERSKGYSFPQPASADNTRGSDNKNENQLSMSSTIATEYVAPRTALEQILADVWKNMLGIDNVGMHDNFFDLGGHSLLLIQMIPKLRNAIRGAQNVAVSQDVLLALNVQQIYQTPTIAALADFINRSGGLRPRHERRAEEDLPLTPVQVRFFEQQLPDRHQFSDLVCMEIPGDIDMHRLRISIDRIYKGHPALRLRFSFHPVSGCRQYLVDPTGPVPFEEMELGALSRNEQDEAIRRLKEQVLQSLNIETGPVFKAVACRFGEDAPGILLLVAHYLIVDQASWCIFLDELERSYRDDAYEPEGRGSYESWTLALHKYAKSSHLEEKLKFWTALQRQAEVDIPLDMDGGENLLLHSRSVKVEMNEEQTAALCGLSRPRENARSVHVLLVSLALTLARWTGRHHTLIEFEENGRDHLDGNVNVKRAIGNFTSAYPLPLSVGPQSSDVEEAVRHMRDRLASVMEQAIDYGVLRYMTENDYLLLGGRAPQIGVRYHDHSLPDPGNVNSIFRFLNCQKNVAADGNQRARLIDIEIGIIDERLHVEWTFSSLHHRTETIQRLADCHLAHLLNAIAIFQ